MLVRQPAVAVGGDALQNAWSFAADQDGRVRSLHRFGFLPDRPEPNVSAVERRLILRPNPLDRQYLLPHDVPPAVRLNTVIRHLFAVPPGANAEDDAPAGQDVEGGHLLRQ